MSENGETRNPSEEANSDMRGVHFIDLEEITDVCENQQDFTDWDELRRTLRQAGVSCRQQREQHDHMLKRGQDIEGLIKEMEAENKDLTIKKKELQQQVENLGEKREEDDEEAALQQELLLEEESLVKIESIYIRRMEKENQKLREKNDDLTAELDQLCLRDSYQEEIQNLMRAEQEFKPKLQELQEVLHSKDEDIEKKSMALIKKNDEIEEYFNNIEDLRQDQQELREQLSSRQEEQILDEVNFLEESTTRSTTSETTQPPGSAAKVEDVEEHKDERLLKTKSWWCRAKGLPKVVKAAGAASFGVLLSASVMASMVSVCDRLHPDCNLWNIAYDLLESYSQHHHCSPVY